jgi:hypothetical protein
MPVAIRPGSIASPPCAPARFLQFYNHLGGERTEIDRFALHLGERHARQGEHVVDQVSHALGGGTHAAEIIPALIVQFAGVILDHRLAEAVYRAQRRAQVVRHRIAE